jgi:Esterase-like activity of phytase
MSTTPITFPCTKGNQVGSSYTLSDGSLLEPSGLVVLNDTLYMASDNGYLVSMNVSPGTTLAPSWTEVHNFTNDSGYDGNSNSYDLESITAATGKLMIGVEGKAGNNGNTYDPHIFRYDTANDDTTSSIWDITDVTLGSAGGMEAMTFVPGSACPPETVNGNPNPAYYGGSQYYGGYFFAAYQSKTGYVYVYDLPEGDNDTHVVSSHLKKFEIRDGNGGLITMEASDMCFADNYLFILFDGGGTQDEIHVFSINPNGSGLVHAGASYLPVLGAWGNQTDFEDLTIDGSDLYLAVDANSTKLVYQFTDYSISKFVAS